MLFRETSARNAIKLRLSVISILLLSKNILHGASITLTSQMPWLRFANAMVTIRKCHGYDSQMPCLRLVNAMFTIFKWWCFGLQTSFAKDEKMLKQKHFYPGFA